MGGGIGQVFGSKKYLWGNMPAFDVLELESNEGIGFKADLRLLFAGMRFLYFLTQLASKNNTIYFLE